MRQEMYLVLFTTLAEHPHTTDDNLRGKMFLEARKFRDRVTRDGPHTPGGYRDDSRFTNEYPK